MKIFITLPSLAKNPGGVASYYNSILPYLHKTNDLEVIIFEVGSTHGEKFFLQPIFDQNRFIKKIISEKPDIVHVNPSLDFKSFIRDGLFVLWAKAKHIPVIVFFHGWQKAFEKHVEGFLKGVFNLTYKKADLFIVLASDFRQKLIFWKINSPVHLLTTAVDESLVQNFSIEEKINRIKKSKNINLLFLSRLEKEKGIFETIDAFEFLLSQGYNIALFIAGDGNIKNDIDRYIANHGLKNKINLLGYVKNDKKIKAFQECDIYCFPTYGEGMPISVLEAMAFGMPVITRPVGGLKDFFEIGRMGYMVESKDPEEIAKYIKKLITDKNKICKIARFNFNYARKHFMASKVADNLRNIYASIFNSQ